MSLVVWKSCSSSQVGCSAFRMSQILLCSLSQMVAYMVRPGRRPNTSCPMARRCSGGKLSGYTMCTGTSETVGGYISPFSSCGWRWTRTFIFRFYFETSVLNSLYFTRQTDWFSDHMTSLKNLWWLERKKVYVIEASSFFIFKTNLSSGEQTTSFSEDRNWN